MSTIIQAKEREDFKGSTLRSLRDNGEIPAVVYGTGSKSEAISVDAEQLRKAIKENGRNAVLSLHIGNDEKNVMLVDYQKDPLKHEIHHVDFLVVNMSEELQASVNIQLVGTSIGVKDGGVLQQSLHELRVETKPGEVPNVIEIDVTELEVGDTMYVSDLTMNGNIKINHSGDEVIASILAPRQEKEINTGEQQDGGIPDNEEGRETSPSEG